MIKSFNFRLSEETDSDAEEEVDEGDEEDNNSEEDFPSDWEKENHLDWNGEPIEYKASTSNLSTYITLGTVPTTNFRKVATTTDETGRMLSFPNWIQASSRSPFRYEICRPRGSYV